MRVLERADTAGSRAPRSLVRLARSVAGTLFGRDLSGPHRRLVEALTPPKLLRIFADATIVATALLLAQSLRHAYHTSFNAGHDVHGMSLTLFSLENVHSTVLVVLISLLIFALSGFYSYGSTYQGRFKLVIISQAVTLSFLTVGTLSFLLPDLMGIPRSVLLLAWAVAWALLVGSRLWSSVWRYVLASENTGAPPRVAVRPNGAPPILVIGGAGYIGSALLPKLLEAGGPVRVLDLLVYGEEPIRDVLHHANLEIINADFRQIDVLVKAVQDAQAVVHLGGLVGDPACACDEALTVDINLAATRAVAEVAKGAGVGKLIFASTCSVYGASDEVLDERSELNPLSLYARSKVASERVLLEAADEHFKPIILRFATVHGLSGRTRFDLVVNLLAAKAVFDGEITVIGGQQWRPFLHVDDAALALAMLLRDRRGAAAFPSILNVGSNHQNFTISAIGGLVRRRVPSARLVELPSDGERRNYRVNFDQIERAIGYRAQYTVEDGIEQVVAAIHAGRIRDYRDPAYSNFSFMNNGGSAFFSRPRPEWARELIAEAGS